MATTRPLSEYKSLPPLCADARCAVALGWDCEMIGAYADTNSRGVTHGHLDDRVVQYMLDLAALAEEAGFRLQYFVLGMTLEDPPDALRGLLARGHALDQHTYDHLPLTCGDRDRIACQLADTSALFEERLGQRPLGLRAPGMHRNGLEGLTEVQEGILAAGMTFVSSHYATRGRQGKYDLAADKNAYMLMKHLQPRRYETGLLEIPASGYSDRHFFDDMGRDLTEWIRHLRECLDFAYDMGGLVYVPALHPDTHARHDPGREALAAVVEHAGKKHEPVRFCTYREVATAHEMAG